MPTVIDSLIVSLGIDAKNMDAKSREATSKLRDLEKQAGKTEDTFKKTEGSVNSLAGAFGKFLAVIGGAVALRRFVEDTIEANAALDRLSKNISTDVPTISAWSNAVEELGGSAKSLQSTMEGLSKAQTELRVTGQSSLVPYLSAVGVSLADVDGKARPVEEILLDLSDRFSRLDRTTAFNLGQMMGIDQGTLNLLLQGRREVELTIARQKEFAAVSKAQAEQASKQQKAIVDLKQSFSAFGRELLQSALPVLEKLVSWLQSTVEWMRQNQETVKVFLTVLAVGLAAIADVTLPIDATVVAITALAAAIALLYQDYQVWKRGGDSFIDWEKWKPGIDAATAAIRLLGDAISAVGDAYKKFYESTTGHKLSVKNFVADAKFAFGSDNAYGTSTTARKPGGSMKAQDIQKFFVSQGWTSEQAAGIAANIIRESGGNGNVIGDNGHAYGLAQWHKDRQAAFAQLFGHDIRQSTVEEQLAFIQHELTAGSEKGAGNALRQATTAQQAGEIVSRKYERPADTEGEAKRRGELAATLSGIKGATGTLAAAGNSSQTPNVSVDRSVENHVGQVVIQTQATDANGIAKGMADALDYQFTAQANTGLD